MYYPPLNNHVISDHVIDPRAGRAEAQQQKPFLQNYPPMTNEELAARIRSGEKDYALQLWKQTERFIGKQARQYMANLVTHRGIDTEDLKQAGYLALIDAAEHYDADGGASFLHFLSFYLHRYFALTAGLQTDRSKSDPINTAISLDAPIKEEDSQTFGDLHGADDHGLDDAEARIYNVELRAALENALDQIRPEDANVIRARFFDEKTLAETAEESGVSTERIRQREQHGLRDLERKARAKKNHLLVYIEQISNYYKRTNFNRTHTSPTEATALRQLQMLEDFELWKEKRQRWLEEMQPWLHEIANRKE